MKRYTARGCRTAAPVCAGERAPRGRPRKHTRTHARTRSHTRSRTFDALSSLAVHATEAACRARGGGARVRTRVRRGPRATRARTRTPARVRAPRARGHVRLQPRPACERNTCTHTHTCQPRGSVPSRARPHVRARVAAAGGRALLPLRLRRLPRARGRGPGGPRSARGRLRSVRDAAAAAGACRFSLCRSQDLHVRRLRGGVQGSPWR